MILFGRVMFTNDSVSLPVPPFAAILFIAYVKMVAPVDELTKSIPILTGTGQSLVKPKVNVPFENDALVKVPNPLPPYVPTFVSLNGGKSELLP